VVRAAKDKGTRAGGGIEQYSIGMNHAASQKWFEVDRSALGLFCWRIGRSDIFATATA
jgi:hypothetical protein